MLLCHLLRLGKAAGKDELTDRREPFLRVLVGVRVGLSCPYRLLIKLYTLHLRTPEDHGPETSIAKRQRLCPYLSGRGVPQAVALTGRREDSHQHNKGEKKSCHCHSI